ncbi:DUF2971 domain-containing protein [Deinococcus sp. ZS9-10]|uniref:DUF2971 domain-containing protein n=2 Tax=Deinococcus arenicola TaxID=2994950 RepID=A0ABU4DTY7_9DEIO|nr:DUF2971 domain-containing protein [Deinococcus sp. ZS9-10]
MGIIEDIIAHEKDLSPTANYGEIYHYTSLETVQKILANETVRFTNIGLLNDTEEYNHSFGILKGIVEKLKTEYSDEIVLLEYLDNIILDLSEMPKIYVACFSRSKDQLSQWRGYTPHGEAACLAFDSFEITESGLEYFPLYDVIYDNERQISLLSSKINIIVKEYISHKDGKDLSRIMKSVIHIAKRGLNVTLSIMKSSMWSEENEVRWIIDLDKSENLRHLRYAMPKTIDIKISKKRVLPITGILFGPQSNSQQNTDAIKALLATKELQSANLEISKIPLRRI